MDIDYGVKSGAEPKITWMDTFDMGHFPLLTCTLFWHVEAILVIYPSQATSNWHRWLWNPNPLLLDIITSPKSLSCGFCSVCYSDSLCLSLSVTFIYHSRSKGL